MRQHLRRHGSADQTGQHRVGTRAGDEQFRNAGLQVIELHVFADDVPIQVPNDRLRLARRRFQDQVLVTAKHKNVANHLALDVGQKGFTARAGRQSFDVVGAESVQESHAIGARHSDLGTVADVDKTGAVRQGRVLFQRFGTQSVIAS